MPVSLFFCTFFFQQVTTVKTTVSHDNSVVTVKITFTKERKLGDPEAIHLYNVLFRRIMVILGLALHGKNFFDPKSAMPIPLHKYDFFFFFLLLLLFYLLF